MSISEGATQTSPCPKATWTRALQPSGKCIATDVILPVRGEGSAIFIVSSDPRAGQFLVLTKLAATEGTADNNIRISISRDTDANYIADLKSYAVGLERELSCFIPAMTELSLNIIAAGPVSPVYIRYTILKVKLSNLLRCRFGLMSKEAAPGDVWAKVLGGIL
ncbi:unnamed protein product [marine sediment metagenome]|uniref:Uncharacterized protein n=1 Tax=marine sediment metagenome TaxID=412755 RepID=X1SQG5_9ZZZZ